MQSFEYYIKTKIIFGAGTRSRAGKLTADRGKKVLLVYSGRPGSPTTETAEAVVRDAEAAGAQVVKLAGVKPNPRLELVYEGIRLCREAGVDFILAVGGGSAIDTAKAVAAGACYDGDVWDFYTGKAVPEKAIPLGSVLTIPAAGSESSDSTVITDEVNKRKFHFSAKCVVPEFAVLDPELCLTLPEYQMQCGVSDMIAHVLERYFTNTPHTDYTDRLCEATLRTLMDNARILSRGIKNVDAWAELMLAGNIAHNGLLGVGREEDWASHNIEHELSAAYDIAHGAGLAIVFPAWMRYVYRDNISCFVQFATRVFDVDSTYDDPEEIALEGIRRFTGFLKEIGLPTTLTEAKLPHTGFEAMAETACRGGGTLGGFKKLTPRDVVNILELAK